MPTCRWCNADIDADNAILLLSNHYVCSEECKKKYKATEQYKKDEFLDYVWFISGKQGNFMKLKKQAEWYKKTYHYKYSGMLYAAKHWVNVEENVWQSQWGLGQIFPDAYNRAKDFYMHQQKLKSKINNTPVVTKTIFIRDSDKKSNKFHINIEEL